MLPAGAHNRFNLIGRNQLPFGDYNLLFAAERAQGRPFAAPATGTPQRQHAIFGDRSAGHSGADPLSLRMVHNSAAAVAASMHMNSQANPAFSRHVAAGLGMKPVMYGSAGNQSAASVPSAIRAAAVTQQQQGVGPSTEAKPAKDAKRRAKRGRQQQQQQQQQQQPRTTASTVQTAKKTKKSNDGEDEEDDETPVGWVQCNRCKEWRQLPRHIDADSLPDQWFCKVG